MKKKVCLLINLWLTLGENSSLISPQVFEHIVESFTHECHYSTYEYLIKISTSAVYLMRVLLPKLACKTTFASSWYGVKNSL